MAEQVSSWFVPQNILDLVSPQEAESAASSARNTFIAGLLSGDIGAAYNNAQNQGYNALSHGAALQEAKRKQIELDRLNQLKGQAYDYPNPIMPVSSNGTELAGPGIPQQPVFNPQKILANPMAPFVDQTHLKTLMENFGPQMEFVNGMAVNKRTVKEGTMIPKTGENQILVQDPSAPGGFRTVVLPGAANAVATLEGAGANARESAKANYDVPTGGVLDKNGNQVAMTRAQIIQNIARGNAPVLSQGEQGKAEGQAYGSYLVKDVLAPAKAAASGARTSNNQIAIAESTLNNTPINQINTNETVRKLAGYAKAAGLLTPEAEQNVSNIASLNGMISSVIMSDQIAQKGTQSESDAKRLEASISGMGDADATKFLLSAKKAQNDRTAAYYDFIDKHKRETGTLATADDAWNKAQGGQSIFREKPLQRYAEVRELNGKRYYVFGDGGAPVPVTGK
jgi:hypothetical protein